MINKENAASRVVDCERKMRVQRLVFSTGERFSWLRGADGFPVSLPLRFVLAELRPKRRSPNTVHQTLEAIRDLYEWAHATAQPFDPEERLRRGAAFTAAEIFSLSSFVRSGGRSRVLVMPGGAVPRQTASRVRADADFNKRFARICSFVVWALNERKDTHLGERVVDRIRKQFDGHLLSVPPTKDRFGLTNDQVVRLLAAVHPQATNNPFNRPVRYRNWILVRFLLNTGVRRGELCGMRVNDLVGRAGVKPFVNVVRRPDDPTDPRKEMPRIKTREREIPVTRELYSDCLTYMAKYRGGRLRHPFLWVAPRGGSPLGLSAINKIFVRIRTRVFAEEEIDLTPHSMRRTFNDEVRRSCKAKNMTPDQSEDVHNYLSGWSLNSQQAKVYTRRSVQEAAMEVAEAMQEKTQQRLATMRSGDNDGRGFLSQ